MKKLILIFLFVATSLQAQWFDPFGTWFSNNVFQYALDFDGSTEYLSCTPALRLTGEYSLYEDFADGNYDGWTVSSGAYSVVDSVPLSGGTKSLKCTTAGVISIPCNQAYGQWEFDLYKGADANRIDILFIKDNSSNIATGSGYCFTFRSNESGTLTRLTSGDGSDILQTATSYITNNTWYSCKITRNTNGQFYLYIKGGTFGSTYTLISVSGGSGSNPVTNNFNTSSNFFVLDLDANDMIANIVCQQGEGSLDLNSYERIYHSDNRNFTKTGGLAWTGAGTHSIDTTSTDKRTGTYSGKLISTDVGDSTTNYISLPAVNFDTLKTDANGVYEKYTLEGWARGVGVVSATNLMNGWNLTNWSVRPGATIVDSNTASGDPSIRIYKPSILTAGKTYKFVFAGSSAQGNVLFGLSTSTAIDITLITNSGTAYYTPTTTLGLAIVLAVVGSLDITALEIYEITQPSITLKIGNQVKTVTGISCVPSTFTKFVFNFQSNALVSNQPILIYLNQADTVYLDDVSLTKAYDVSYNYWINTTSANTSITSNNSSKDYTQIVSNKFTHQVDASSTDWTNVDRYTSSNVNTGTWNYLTAPYNRITATVPNIYFNGALNNGSTGSSLMSNAGKVTTATTSLLIGLRTSTYYTGKLGHIQIIKFADISQSNVNSTTLTTAYNRGKLIQNEWIGGSPVEVAFYDWKGSTTNEILTDKSGTGNNLTGTNMDINDRVKVKGKFK